MSRQKSIIKSLKYKKYHIYFIMYLFVNLKISGSAYKVNLGNKKGEGRKALHHGTMLLNLQS